MTDSASANPTASSLQNCRLPVSFSGLRVTVMGLGTFGGAAEVVRFLVEQGAVVTVTDRRTEDDLRESFSSLSGCDIKWVLGAHPESVLDDCQLLVVNPAVRPNHPLVSTACRRGILTTTELEMTLARCAARVFAVTGSNGKSTTAVLLADMVRQQTGDRVLCGGNLGGSLIRTAGSLTPDDSVVLEVSSFQLFLMKSSGFRPHVAVLTNLTPNHLDWHGSFRHYADTKLSLFRHLTPDCTAVVPTDLSPELMQTFRTRGKIVRFGNRDSGEEDVWCDGSELTLRTVDNENVLSEESVRLVIPPGLDAAHLHADIAAAAAGATAAGADTASVVAAVKNFRGLPHRMQSIQTDAAGIRFIDDSASTTPESTIAALNSLPDNIVLLVGGTSKGGSSAALAATIARSCRAVILMGAVSEELELLIRAAWRTECRPENTCPLIRSAADPEHAFRLAVEVARSGDIVLLSPGFASFGWFREFQHRGRMFADAVQRLTQSGESFGSHD